MIRTISIFKDSRYGWEHVYIHAEGEQGDKTALDYSDNHIRLSTAVQIDFPEVDKTEALKKELELIDKAEKTIAAEYQLKLTSLQNKRNDLLSISHDGGNNNQE